ncbi:plexin-B-like, partial [Patiria miniata]|uniref:Sema domain-containing protein n=1 Tax=Patiria miniata TaxID=46514 RepID=A0A914ADD2_PATMI
DQKETRAMATRGRAKPILILAFQLLLIGGLVPSVCMEWSGRGTLADYEVASFDNPIEKTVTVTTQLDHFAVQPETGDVYVGAVNYLYKLNKELKQVTNVSTCSEDTCLSYNKVLALHAGMLITCGTERPNSDQCQLRSQDDLEGDGSRRGRVVAFGTKSTASIIAPVGMNPSTPRLYIANTYSTEGDYQDIQPIARRLVSSGGGFMFADSGTDAVQFTSGYTDGSNPFPISYVSVFNWKGFTYFATFQKEDLPPLSAHISKLTRLCHNTDNVRSYTEILIECRGPSGLFSLIQAAHVGPAGPHLEESLALDDNDQVLYAVFARDKQAGTSNNPVPAADSALCVYKMRDIEAAFSEAVRGCIQDNDDNYEIGIFTGTVCGNQPSVDPESFLCNTGNHYRYATGITPVVGTSVVHLPGHLASSIITSTEYNHTMAFIGTTEGQLLKVHIESSTLARLYESVTLDGEPVMKDTMLNETKEEVFVLTEQQLIRMRVENCGRYTTCEACIGTDAGNDGDPYCGWCTLERKCTRYHDCPLQDVSTRWLAYNDAQCIEISQVIPHNSLPITLTDQQIMLTVQQLPALLDSWQYECRFEEHFTSQATNYNGDSFNCMTPPASNIPAIPSGEDHVTVTLSVMSTETSVDFVDIDFSFYECDTHKTCVSCVGSEWACNWCVFENKCTHDNSTCSKMKEIFVTGQYSRGTAMQGPVSCPQLQPQPGEVLIPNVIQREINVTVDNLPDASETTSFLCSLDVEGSAQSVAATRADSTVTCDSKAYNYTATVQELNASLTLQWTDKDNVMHTLDDTYDFTVTLYKCEVLRPDCSRCISDETTRAELGCMWCGDTCGVTESTVCMTADEKVTLQDNRNCPDPVLMQVYPLFGPFEGNTLLTVSGTDIGLRYSDVREVTLGGEQCTLENYAYSTGYSVSCRTLEGAATRRRRDVTPLTLQVRITGRDGTMQTSQGDVTFGYKDPDISGFSPEIGPQSGGTRLTISGQSLDAGRFIEVFIDDMQCAAERAIVTDDSITCITSRADNLGSWIVNVSFDGAERLSMANYTYTVDPDVEEINPSTSVLAGGRELTVNGSGFSIIQQPQIVITYGDNEQEFVGNCSVTSDDKMICTSPEINLPNLVLDADTSVNVTTGFIMDAVEALRTWCSVDQNDGCTPLEYFQNPEYYPFNDPLYENEDGIEERTGPELTVKGARLNLAITNEEVTVYVGKSLCTAVTVGAGALSCKLPVDAPAAGDYLGMNATRGLPVVWVIHGTTLSFNIGYFQYPVDNTVLIVCVVSVGVLVLAGLLAVGLYKKSKGAQEEVDKRLDDIDNVQAKLADDMRTAFAELQTDVSDVTSDLEGIGMPFNSHREYATNMLFIGQDTKPMTTDPENPEEHVEKAMKKFSDALGNKTFLLMFLQTLDAQSKAKLSVKDRGAIASLLTVIMVAEGKLDYLSDVLFSLMAKLVQDELDANRPRQLFRRTETILEKLLSNWITLCLYDSLKDHTAYPLFVLYRAIKCHSEHGPMDIISGQAKFTLSDEKLLTEDIDYREMVLTVIVNNADGETKEVKVLDVDTISQVKEKILDAIHRSQPYSRRPSADQVDLEWHAGANGRQILRDVDHTSVTSDGWKRVNTLRFYHVPNKSTMALLGGSSGTQKPASDDNVYVNFGSDDTQASASASNYMPMKPASRPPRSNRFTMVEAPDDDAKIWHLLKCEESDYGSADASATKRRNKRLSKRLSMIASRPKKRIRELYIPRLISTKGTIQDYINRMFQAILNADTAPKAVKYLFDFFDSQAVRHSIQDSEAVRTWKGNSLSLRFWSNAIRRPDFIFDIRPSRSVESSLGIIAQAFYDAHNASDQKLSKDSDLSKLLFNKDLPRIQSLVEDYYDGISNKPRVTLQELNNEMSQTSQSFTGLFSKLSTLLQLWHYVKKYNTKIVEACEDDDACKNEHLAYKLVEVETILDNEDCDAQEAV